MKGFLKHALTVALITVLVFFALGSDGSVSTPSSNSGGSSSSSRCPEANTCRFFVHSDGRVLYQNCSRDNCRVDPNRSNFDTTPGTNITCNCP